MKEQVQSTTANAPLRPEDKPTLVVGASLKPVRYSNKAIRMLREHDVPVFAIGLREGRVEDVDIVTEKDAIPAGSIHSVTMYMNAYRQEPYYDFLVALAPKRVIFNPGAENRQLAEILQSNGIEVVEACTLVMLTLGHY